MRPAPMPDLWHFTCDHGHAGLVRDGYLRTLIEQGVSPERLPAELQFLTRIVWMTDLKVAIPDALGLTRNFTTCDRTAHRWRVADATMVKPWIDVARQFDQHGVLQESFGARPRHWYVSESPVPVEPSDA